MRRRLVLGAILSAFVIGEGSGQSPQVSAKVDFRQTVQPLFRQYCVGCHGPSQQMSGLRLDRRRDAMRGGSIADIGPGNSAGSRLYLKLVGNEYGLRMPPTGPLSPEQIDLVKAWIDQGAEWPDDLSGETPPPPPDPKATRIMEALRHGDRQTFKKLLTEEPTVANLKGPGGSTPLMYAVLYGDAVSVRLLLDHAADANIRNEAGATALMWAVDDLEKSRLLVEHGADVNARSDDGRTPLIIAAGRSGSSPVVKLLLDHGANPSVKSLREMTPLGEAANIGDEATLRLLVERGADVKDAAPRSLSDAVRTNCGKCADLLIASLDRAALNPALLSLAPNEGDARDARAIGELLDRGADVNAKDPDGRTMLMLAASSDAIPVETVKALIDRGADVNARTPRGQDALTFAKLRGDTPIVELLTKAGAKATSESPAPVPKPAPTNSVRATLERSLPLLQQNDVTFIKKSGCVSCHNDTLTAMTVATARTHGFPIDEETARRQLKTIATYVESWRERALQGVGIAGDSDTVSYILVGMAAEHHPPDAATDALARYLKSKQLPDGRWRILGHRPPIESSDFEVTATSMRAIQVYAPKPQRAEYEKAVRLAAGWLMQAQPKTTEDRAFQLLGLGWAGANKAAIRKAAGDLVAEQRPDGGWAQLPSLASDAYATGQALVALKETGTGAATGSAYKRGIRFLLNTQLEDGSWYVKSRAIPFQPHFESGFPHGRDQFISAAATNWAAMALALQ